MLVTQGTAQDKRSADFTRSLGNFHFIQHTWVIIAVHGWCLGRAFVAQDIYKAIMSEWSCLQSFNRVFSCSPEKWFTRLDQNEAQRNGDTIYLAPALRWKTGASLPPWEVLLFLLLMLHKEPRRGEKDFATETEALQSFSTKRSDRKPLYYISKPNLSNYHNSKLLTCTSAVKCFFVIMLKGKSGYFHCFDHHSH